MTFLHFLNCALLTLAPNFVVFKATKLSEFRALAVCSWGVLAYIATQLVKMILLATFMPLSELSGASFDYTQEIPKSIFNFIDIMGVHFVINYISGCEGDLRILGVGLGWASAESIMMRVAPLWIGARSLEFDWSFVQIAVEANVSLLVNISFVALVWLWSRKKLDKTLQPVVILALFVHTMFPLVLSYLRLILPSWTVLGIYASTALSLSLISRLLYSSFVAKQK